MTNFKSLLNKGMTTIVVLALIPVFFAFNYQSGVHFFPTPATVTYVAETSETAAKKIKSFAWAPNGAKVVKAKNGGIKIMAPKDFKYIGVTPAGKFVGLNQNVTSAKITCTCTEGSGCSPGSGLGKVGCEFGGCTKCSGTLSIKIPTTNIAEVLTMSGGGFVKSQPDVRLATKADLENAAFVFPEMAQSPTIQSAIKAFKTKATERNTGETVVALVHISGRITAMKLPKSFASKGIVLSAKGSCDCTEGTCSWVKITGVGGGCKAKDCSGSCTLDTGIKAPTGEPLTVEAFGF